MESLNIDNNEYDSSFGDSMDGLNSTMSSPRPPASPNSTVGRPRSNTATSRRSISASTSKSRINLGGSPNQDYSSDLVLFNSSKLIQVPNDIDSNIIQSLCIEVLTPRLSEEHSQFLADCLTVVELSSGAVIAKQGQKSSFWFVILSGSVDIIKNDEKVQNEKFVKGDIIDASCYYERNTRRTVTYICAEDSIIGIMPTDDMALLECVSNGLSEEVKFLLAAESIKMIRKQGNNSDKDDNKNDHQEEEGKDNDNDKNNDDNDNDDEALEDLLEHILVENGKQSFDRKIEMKKRLELISVMKKSKHSNLALARKSQLLKHKADQYDNLNKQFTNTREQLKQKKLELDSNYNKEKKILHKYNEAKKEADSLKKKLKTEVKAIEKTMEEAIEAESIQKQNIIDDLRNEIRIKNDEILKYKKTIQLLKDEQLESEQNTHIQLNTHSELSSMLSREKQRVVSLEITIQQLTSDNTNLTSQNKEYKVKIDRLEDRADLYQKSLDASEADLRDTIDQLREYKMQASSIEALKGKENTILNERLNEMTTQFQIVFGHKEDYSIIIRRLAVRMFIKNFRLRKRVYNCLRQVAEIMTLALEVENDIKCPSVQESDLEAMKCTTNKLLSDTYPPYTELLNALDQNLTIMKTPLTTLLKKLKSSANFFFMKNVQVASDLQQTKTQLIKEQNTLNDTLGLLSERTEELETMQEEHELALNRIAKLERMREHWQKMEQKQKLEETRDVIFARSYNTAKKHSNRVESVREASSNSSTGGGNNHNDNSENGIILAQKQQQQQQDQKKKHHPLNTHYVSPHHNKQRPSSGNNNQLRKHRSSKQLGPKRNNNERNNERKHEDRVWEKVWDWDRSRESLAKASSPSKKKKNNHNDRTNSVSSSSSSLNNNHHQLNKSRPFSASLSSSDIKNGDNPLDDDANMESWLNAKYKKKISLGDGWEPLRR